VRPAARLSDVARVLDEMLPRVIAFSGHENGGYLLFEPDAPSGAARGAPSAAPSGRRTPHADEFIELLCPARAPELQCLFLNACKTERICSSNPNPSPSPNPHPNPNPHPHPHPSPHPHPNPNPNPGPNPKQERIAREIHAALNLTIVCWRGKALDAAARAFSCGFYAALAKDEPPAVAFDAGRAQMSLSGFCEGDPDDYLHPAGHEHLRAPRRRDCPGCNPPVHGEVVLVGGGR